MNLTHLIAGPAEHGVTEYARLLAENTGGRVGEPGEHPVHVTFTDHLFGPTPDEAVDALLSRLAGRRFSVSFHDVPQEGEGAERFARRAGAYQRLAAAADIAVTNSRHEAAFFDTEVEVIPLPLPTAPSLDIDPEPGTVGVLGFIYPGKGHSVVAEAAGDLRVRALGGFSAGHEDMDLPGVEVTGYLSEEDLWAEMARIAVPVCPHLHVSASGSMMRWLAAGRRVLVADSTYAREVAGLFPDQVRLVNDWAADIAAAAADPDFSRTVELPVTWGWPEVATRWQELWAETFAAEFRGNVLADTPTETPSVSVVIPHYNNPEMLTRVIRGLEAQTFDGPLEVIVADDGSAELPRVDTPLPLQVVSQEDRGFRAAAARNLGAARASNDVLVFLDADTVPEPDFVRAAASRVARDPACVVVGTRLQEDGEPQWLIDAWQRTRDLTLADDTSWRFIISSVLALPRELFTSVGGFDESMVGYGGEDWELGWRLWNAGAKFRHVPEAVATHLEPEWAKRGGGAEEKNVESVALAHRITHPLARPDGVVFADQDVAVELPDGTPEPVIASWLAAGDVRVLSPLPELFSADPRVGPGSARLTLTLSRPLLAPADLPEVAARIHALGGAAQLVAGGEVVGSALGRRVSTDTPALVHVGLSPWAGPERLERWFAGW